MIFGFNVVFRRCPNGSGLFSLFKQFLETEMTLSPQIIVRKSALMFCVALNDDSGLNPN